ncbi:putative Ribosome assembly factor mrt4 protein, partial [Naja naja]
IFFGKNKVMIVALGHSPSDEYKDNLHEVKHQTLKTASLHLPVGYSLKQAPPQT